MKNKVLFILSLVLCTNLSFSQTPSIYISEKEEPMMTGTFKPEWNSLKNYKVPEWFRNAKFGIWAHWGPQCVEGTGDWMARTLYIEGSNEYKYHKEHYGHPSTVGFKDIIPLFKAEKWNPDKLVAFYKRIGAQYFVALGNHHDNFDLWDSKYQPWNSTNMGPKKDILRAWEKAARKHGLHFGISLHADHAWLWYEPAQRHDLTGPQKGISYDGKLTKEDGIGKWWEGYDPQDLYEQRHALSKDSWNNGAIYGQWTWSNGAAIPTQEYCTKFYNRTIDVINKYNPDLLYFDATILPLYPISDAGLKIAAHFYNRNMLNNNGQLEGVLLGKILDENQRKALVWDVERGAPNEIIPEPWQTCSCLGGWHYNMSIYNNNSYKSASDIAKILIDIISKNGNLLLSVPLRADGTFDEKEERILIEFGDWFTINKEAIYDTRPWIIFGEGSIADAKIELNAQGFNENSYSKATAEEIRFTKTENNLYVFALGWPTSKKIEVKALSSNSRFYKQNINEIELLGYGNIPFSRTATHLIINLPEKNLNKICPVFKIK